MTRSNCFSFINSLSRASTCVQLNNALIIIALMNYFEKRERELWNDLAREVSYIFDIKKQSAIGQVFANIMFPTVQVDGKNRNSLFASQRTRGVLISKP